MLDPAILAGIAGPGLASDTLSVLGPTVRILADHRPDDDICLISGEMGPGILVPPHSHADAETWYVARGAVQVFREGWTETTASSSFRIVDGVRHALHNRSDAPVGMLLVTAVRMGRFLRAIGTPVGAAPSGPPSPEALGRLVAAAQQFGYWLGGPEDNAGLGLRLG